MYLVPRAMYKDPFRGGDAILVMCDAYEPPKVKEDGSVAEPVAIPTNTRAACAVAMKKVEAEVCNAPQLSSAEPRPRVPSSHGMLC